MLHGRCPFCSTALDVPDSRAGTRTECPACGKPFHLPGNEAVRTTGNTGVVERDELTFDRTDRHEPSLGRDSRATSGGWRFVSPSALVLALLTLPMPWVEVRCQNTQSSSNHYTQTGAQMLIGQTTRFDKPAAPGPGVVSGSIEQPGRLTVAWMWVLVVVAGIAIGLMARTFSLALISLILSCVSVAFLLLLIVVIFVGEIFNSVQLSPWPLIALLACLVGMGGSITAFVVLVRRRRDPNEDEDYP